MDWSKCKSVERSLKIMSGEWVFKGTRIPVTALFLNLRDGATVEEFIDWFPGVTSEQVSEVLDYVATESPAAA